MKSIFILYRPVLDYEESENSYLACETLKQAQKVRTEIISECSKIASQLIYELGDISDDEYVKFYTKNQEVLGSAKWPYELTQLKYDLQKHSEYDYDQEKFVDSYVFNENAIAIMELPLI